MWSQSLTQQTCKSSPILQVNHAGRQAHPSTPSIHPPSIHPAHTARREPGQHDPYAPYSAPAPPETMLSSAFAALVVACAASIATAKVYTWKVSLGLLPPAPRLPLACPSLVLAYLSPSPRLPLARPSPAPSLPLLPLLSLAFSSCPLARTCRSAALATCCTCQHPLPRQPWAQGDVTNWDVDSNWVGGSPYNNEAPARTVIDTALPVTAYVTVRCLPRSLPRCLLGPPVFSQQSAVERLLAGSFTLSAVPPSQPPAFLTPKPLLAYNRYLTNILSTPPFSTLPGSGPLLRDRRAWACPSSWRGRAAWSCGPAAPARKCAWYLAPPTAPPRRTPLPRTSAGSVRQHPATCTARTT